MSQFNYQRGEWISVGDSALYVEEIGACNKPALVCLHGGFGSMLEFNSLVELLCDSFRIVGIDTRGHGKSPLGGKTLTYAQFEADVVAVLQELSLTNVSILGFSDGGITAYRIAARSDIVVEKLITIGASWCNKDIDDSREILSSMNVEMAKEMFQESYKNYMVHNPSPGFEQLVDASVSLWLDESDTGYPNELVGNISAETLLIRGEGDFLFSQESLMELQNRITNAHICTIPMGAHDVLSEEFDITNTVIRRFLSL